MVMMKSSVRRLSMLWGIIFSFGFAFAIAQEQGEEPATKQYREDYERFQKILGVGDPIKKADGLLTFLTQRPDSKLTEYAQGNYLQILETFAKGEKYQNVLTLAERLIKLRPRVGETYYFCGVALKNLKRYPEAMDALAKCYVMKNRASAKARDFLDFVYKSQNQGNIVGVEKIIKKAQDEIGK
jgi:tetratricopeptide (TPR) repeat protein